MGYTVHVVAKSRTRLSDFTSPLVFSCRFQNLQTEQASLLSQSSGPGMKACRPTAAWWARLPALTAGGGHGGGQCGSGRRALLLSSACGFLPSELGKERPLVSYLGHRLGSQESEGPVLLLLESNLQFQV